MDLSDSEWLVEQNEFRVSGHLETCFTLANGYLGSRGTFEEQLAGETPGTYIAGVYDGENAETKNLVNLPFFFGLQLYVNQRLIDLTACTILEFYRALDMRQGLLYKQYRVQDEPGRITRVFGYRFVSHAHRNLSGMRYTVIPENYAERVTVESVIDGTVLNFRGSPLKRAKHFRVAENASLPGGGVYLEAATFEHGHRIGFASLLDVQQPGGRSDERRRRTAFGERAVDWVDVQAGAGEPIRVSKYVVVASSRDTMGGGTGPAFSGGEPTDDPSPIRVESTEPEANALREVRFRSAKLLEAFAAGGIERALHDSARILSERSDAVDIRIEGDSAVDNAVRFNLYHLMGCSNPSDERVSIGAKGLHGDGYRGQVFWDSEIFILPFFVHTQPETARALLMYRYHMLEGARWNARENGYRGAQYPWQSADTGREETPQWGYDARSNPIRLWTGELQHHVTAAIAHGVWYYYRVTADAAFLLDYGMEIILETARFWVSRVEFNGAAERYEIRNVVGPDEFHERIDNNLYTNYMAQWNIRAALDLTAWIAGEHPQVYKALTSRLSLTESELNHWADVAGKIHVAVAGDDRVLEQFDGYFQLEDRVVTQHDENNMPDWPADIDPMRVSRTTLIKQADVVLLLHLFGDHFSADVKRANYEYYLRRTMHVSSLSPCIYGQEALAVADFSTAYDDLLRSATVDLHDRQGNASSGLHAASAGGTWQLVVFGFGGMHLNGEGVLAFAPSWIPDWWRALSYTVRHRGSRLRIRVTSLEIRVQMVEGDGALPIEVNGDPLRISPGEQISRPLPAPAP